jgi:O-antigen ligase
MPTSVGSGPVARPGAQVTATLVASAVGVCAAFLALYFASLEGKWSVYLTGAIVAATAALVFPFQRFLYGVLLLTIQVNAHYWLSHVPMYMRVGQSGAIAFSVALVTIPASALLLYHVANAPSPGLFLRSALRAVGLPTAVLVLVLSLSALASDVRFFGLCTVFELLQYCLLFTVGAVCVRSRRDVHFTYVLLLIVLGTQSCIFFLQNLTGASFSAVGQVVWTAGESGLLRAGGTVGTVPAGFVEFIVPLALIAAASFLASTRSADRALFATLAALGLAGSFLTLNRTALVGVPMGVLIVLRLCKRRGHSRGAAIAIFVVLALALTVAAPRVTRRVEKQDFGDDWNQRITLMGVALRMAGDNPVLGVGPSGYPYHMSRYPIGALDWAYVVHNEYLMRLADTGLLGFSAWLAWFGVGVRRVYRCTRSKDPLFRTIAIGVFAALCVRMWNWLWWAHMPFSAEALLWFLLGLMVAIERLEFSPTVRRSPAVG